MIEPEMAFADLSDMDLAEKMLKYLISYVLKKLEEWNFNRSLIRIIRALDLVLKSDLNE